MNNARKRYYQYVNTSPKIYCELIEAIFELSNFANMNLERFRIHGITFQRIL